MDDDEIKASLAHLSNDLGSALRQNPLKSELAGWGQFLNAEDHIYQIGPYGTSAAILYRQVALDTPAIDARVVAQLQDFWDNPTENKKLRLQNVRVAFLVLALANVENPELQKVREGAIAALFERQLDEGS